MHTDRFYTLLQRAYLPSQETQKGKSEAQTDTSRLNNQGGIFSSAGEFSAAALGLTGISLSCSSSVFSQGILLSSHCCAGVCDL